MKKVFISQPMNGLSKEEIMRRRENAIEKLNKYLGDDIEILDTYISAEETKDFKIPAIAYLGKSIEILANADIAYFMEGWIKARGCSIEHSVAVSYGCVKVIYE